MAATAIFVLAAMSAGALLAAAPVTAGPSTQNLEVLAFGEDFEGVLGARGWSFADNNPANGEDFWAASTNRADTGNGSAWSAGVGDRLSVFNLWESNFENGTTGWIFADRNATETNGEDYWGISTQRAHNGTNSIWCAQVGMNRYNGGNAQSNAQMRLYDSSMNATAVINTDLIGLSNVQLEYWMWRDSENSWDNLYVAFFDGTWHWENQKFPNKGASLGWQMYTYPIPSSASQVGFMFTSDGSINYEGVYLDDIRLYYTSVDSNRDLGRYDDNMDAQMMHDVDVSYFDSARLEYRYWLDLIAPNDTLSVMLFDGTTWTFVDPHTGTSGGWAASSIPIPTTTRAVGFQFVSNGTGRGEGAYVDDLHVWGAVLPVTCTAVAYETGGMEVVTDFHFGADASGGLRPYSWAWVFGDGTSRSGTLASDRNPIHSFPGVGIYTPVLTVTDSLAQTCSTSTASITVSHDISTVLITPASARAVEGSSLTVYGFDGQGHPYELDWELQFPECGSLSRTHGENVTVNIATDAGGAVCQVVGYLGSARSTMRLTVGHDTSVINISPLTATVIEGHGLRLAATDRYGGELPFLWTTTCGRVGGAASTFTLFEAVIEGGVVCTVTASYGADHAETIISIVHDTANIDVTPKSATIVEGFGQTFSAIDGYGHPFQAEWSVDPSSCGAFSIGTGATTTFTSSVDAGGTDCVINVDYGVDHHEVPVSVLHDVSSSSVTPTSVSLQAGQSAAFVYGDANGHPFPGIWSVSPGGCGVFEHSNVTIPVPSNKLTVSGDFVGYTCTVSATGIGFTRFASVVVEYGAPTTLLVTPSSDVVEADGQVLVSVAVKDAAGHTIPSIAVDWTTTGCGASVSPAHAQTTTLTAPLSSAGSLCAVTASYLTITGTASVRVNHVGPFTIHVIPASPALSGGQSQVFTATVTDGAGAPVPDAAIVWSSTCGQLSNTTGSTVVFTAPADVGSARCEVVAAASAGGIPYQSAATVQAGGSSMVFILLAVVAAAVVAGLLVMRMRGSRASAAPPGEAPASYNADAGVAPAPEAAAAEAAPAALACPRCGSAIEVGWTACPECGTDLPAA